MTKGSSHKPPSAHQIGLFGESPQPKAVESKIEKTETQQAKETVVSSTPKPESQPVAVHAGQRGISVVTWNVNSIRARLEHLMAYLSQQQPDILLLQETKVDDKSFPLEPLSDQGYNIALYGQKTYNGVAILSKAPIEDIQRGLPTFAHDDARYIDGFTMGLRVASVYVPNGQSVESDKYGFKLEFFKHLRQRILELHNNDEAFVVAGDYNVAPEDIDVHSPKEWHEQILCTTAERQALRGLFGAQMTDALRAQHPDARDLFTWWDYRAQSFARNDGLRIDHILLSPLAADRLIDAGVDRDTRAHERASDHAPVWCRLSTHADPYYR